jgi:hypothetical protein
MTKGDRIDPPGRRFQAARFHPQLASGEGIGLATVVAI